MTESPQALAAFTDYQAQSPPRSLDRLADTYRAQTESRPPTRHLSTLKQWSTDHRWQDRVRAHDQAIADAAAERDKAARLAEIDRRREDRIKVAAAVRGKGVQALAKMSPDVLANRPYAVVQMLDYADKTERLDMGEATERTEHQGPGGGPQEHRHTLDLSDLSDEELAILERVAERMAGRSPQPGGDPGREV